MQKTLAIVLKKQNLGETDRILTIFSPSLGKKRVVVKAIRRPLSKMAGHLDTFMVSQIILTEKDELPTVTSAELIESFEHLRGDYQELQKAFSVSKIVERAIIEDVPQQAIFQIMLDALVRIDREESWPIIWLKLLSDLAKSLGLGLNNFHCSKCQEKICDRAIWQDDQRTFICVKCAKHLETLTIQANTVKLLQLLGRKSFDELRKLRFEDDVAKEAERIMLSEITNWFNRPSSDFVGLKGQG